MIHSHKDPGQLVALTILCAFFLCLALGYVIGLLAERKG